jgi:hypothetical protein
MDDYIVIGMSPEHAASMFKMLGGHLVAFQQGAGALRNAQDLGFTEARQGEQEKAKNS